MDIISKTIEYCFAPDEIKKLFAKELNVPVEKIDVRYYIEEVGGDPLDRYPGTDTVTKIFVSVDSK